MAYSGTCRQGKTRAYVNVENLAIYYTLHFLVRTNEDRVFNDGGFDADDFQFSFVPFPTNDQLLMLSQSCQYVIKSQSSPDWHLPWRRASHQSEPGLEEI